MTLKPNTNTKDITNTNTSSGTTTNTMNNTNGKQLYQCSFPLQFEHGIIINIVIIIIIIIIIVIRGS